jgi:L-fuconolactonase
LRHVQNTPFNSRFYFFVLSLGGSACQRCPAAFRDFTPHLKQLFDAFGPRRCQWGTDMTNGYDKATYKQRVIHFTEELSFLSEEDKDWVMGKAILERLKWA